MASMLDRQGVASAESRRRPVAARRLAVWAAILAAAVVLGSLAAPGAAVGAALPMQFSRLSEPERPVTLRAGERAIAFSTPPAPAVRGHLVQTVDRSGTPSAVYDPIAPIATDDGRLLDLGLRETSAGTFVPRVAATPTTIPASLDAVTWSTDLGPVRLEPLAMRAAPAARLGDAVTYDAVAPGTSAVLRAVPTGVALHLMITSPDAPFTYAFRLRLPAGVAANVTESGSLGLRRGDAQLGELTPIRVTDALGRQAAGAYRLDGDRLTIDVSRATADGTPLELPLDVDPEFSQSFVPIGTGVPCPSILFGRSGGTTNGGDNAYGFDPTSWGDDNVCGSRTAKAGRYLLTGQYASAYISVNRGALNDPRYGQAVVDVRGHWDWGRAERSPITPFVGAFDQTGRIVERRAAAAAFNPGQGGSDFMFEDPNDPRVWRYAVALNAYGDGVNPERAVATMSQATIRISDVTRPRLTEANDAGFVPINGQWWDPVGDPFTYFADVDYLKGALPFLPYRSQGYIDGNSTGFNPDGESGRIGFYGPALADGPHRYDVASCDFGDDVAERCSKAGFAWTTDRTPPALALDYANPLGRVGPRGWTPDPSFTIGFTDNDAGIGVARAEFHVFRNDGTPISNWTIGGQPHNNGDALPAGNGPDGFNIRLPDGAAPGEYHVDIHSLDALGHRAVVATPPLRYDPTGQLGGLRIRGGFYNRAELSAQGAAAQTTLVLREGSRGPSGASAFTVDGRNRANPVLAFQRTVGAADPFAATFTLPPDLQSGRYRVLVTTTSGAGVVGPAVENPDDIRIDVEAPNVLVASSSGWARTATTANVVIADPTVNDVSSGADHADATLDGARTPIGADGTIPIAADGRHRLEVVGYDRAGNPSAPQQREVLVDQTKPTGVLSLNAETVSVAASDATSGPADADLFVRRVGTADWGAALPASREGTTWSASVGEREAGSYEAAAVVTDVAGNSADSRVPADSASFAPAPRPVVATNEVRFVPDPPSLVDRNEPASKSKVKTCLVRNGLALGGGQVVRVLRFPNTGGDAVAYNSVATAADGCVVASLDWGFSYFLETTRAGQEFRSGTFTIASDGRIIADPNPLVLRLPGGVEVRDAGSAKGDGCGSIATALASDTCGLLTIDGSRVAYGIRQGFGALRTRRVYRTVVRRVQLRVGPRTITVVRRSRRPVYETRTVKGRRVVVTVVRLVRNGQGRLVRRRIPKPAVIRTYGRDAFLRYPDRAVLQGSVVFSAPIPPALLRAVRATVFERTANFQSKRKVLATAPLDQGARFRLPVTPTINTEYTAALQPRSGYRSNAASALVQPRVSFVTSRRTIRTGVTSTFAGSIVPSPLALLRQAKVKAPLFRYLTFEIYNPSKAAWVPVALLKTDRNGRFTFRNRWGRFSPDTTRVRLRVAFVDDGLMTSAPTPSVTMRVAR